MNVTFSCPECEQAARTTVGPAVRTLACPHCRAAWDISDSPHDGRVERCLVCPSEDLYVRKDFPQRLGVTIVVLGFAASCVAWYYHELYWTFGILFATALLDIVLYLVFGNALVCYRCGATYREVEGLNSHRPFELEVHERHRQRSAREAEIAARQG
jgi:hypothetical protein